MRYDLEKKDRYPDFHKLTRGGEAFEKTKPGKNVRIVSVGPKTAKKVKDCGLESEVIEKFSSEHFADHLGDIAGKTIGIARAEVPNPELIASLDQRCSDNRSPGISVRVCREQYPRSIG